MSNPVSNVVELTDASFGQEVVKAGMPVLVDFWAPWCGPCRAVAPTIEAVAARYAGRAKVAKLNVDEHRAVASALRIQAIPAVAVFKGDRVIDLRVGALPKGQYEEMLDKALAATQA